MYADYVAAHRTIQTKNIQNTASFIQNDVNTQYPMKNKRTETVTCSKSGHWTKIMLQDNPNLQVLLTLNKSMSS